MSAFENRLVFACKQVGEASAEILDWIDSNKRLVGTERVALLHELYRSESSARRLAAAVNQMPATAFVGPRRSGKTQIITNIIEQGRGRLSLRFDGIREPIDYARQIVPEGTRAGISMIVRLSQKTKATPQSFPITMRLLTLAEVVKILGSAYFSASTARGAVPSQARARKAHEEAASRMSADPVPGLSEEDIWDLRGYFASRFGDEPLYRALSASGFWQSLARIAPSLSNAERAKLLSPLWGGLRQFTRVFGTLADALASLGGSQEANCALDAILSLDPRTGKFSRRADSVISGDTVHRLGLPDAEAVVVCNEFGHWISVPRISLAALGAEVRLPIPGWPCELIEKADVLELPGIDHRESVPGLAKELSADHGLIGRLFMRAKAVHLLDSYGADHKITSMVLCIDPSTRKVGELASLVAAWVDASHGRDATAREHNENALFLALTKLDKELAETPRMGRERPLEIPGRIGEILNDGFGGDFSWPSEWTPTRPFDNVFLLRNPAHKAKHLVDYTPDGREKGFKSGQAERIERARGDFVRSETARRHVADPVSVWREAFTLNDGGVTYLAQSVAAVTSTRVKHRQIVNALTELRHAMKDRLTRYYVSDNYAFQHDRRRTTGLAVARRLRGCAEQRRFGHLLRSLQLSDSEFFDVLVNCGIWTGRDAKREAGAVRNEKAGKQAGGEQPGEGEKSAASREAELLTRTALDHWVETVRAVPLAAGAPRKYQMPRQAIAYLVDEIIAGANRLEMDERVAAQIEQLTSGERDGTSRLTKAALCIANAVGDYVMTLGFSDVFSNSHPRRRGTEQTPIFPPRAALGLSGLDVTADYDREFTTDWSQAFMTLVDDNATGLREGDIDDEQNRRLGRLLRLLDVTL
jgi:hypothetical protein